MIANWGNASWRVSSVIFLLLLSKGNRGIICPVMVGILVPEANASSQITIYSFEYRFRLAPTNTKLILKP